MENENKMQETSHTRRAVFNSGLAAANSMAAAEGEYLAKCNEMIAIQKRLEIAKLELKKYELGVEKRILNETITEGEGEKAKVKKKYTNADARTAAKFEVFDQDETYQKLNEAVQEAEFKIKLLDVEMKIIGWKRARFDALIKHHSAYLNQPATGGQN